VKSGEVFVDGNESAESGVEDLGLKSRRVVVLVLVQMDVDLKGFHC
jgi:hypothetical protein